MTDKIDQVFEAVKWWRRLTGNNESGYQSGGCKAALSQLRRATAHEAQFHPEVAQLWKALGYKSPSRLPRVAALAICLANIRADDDRSLGRSLGREKIDDPSSARLKLGRFQSMMREDAEDEEFALCLRRAIDLAGNRARVRDVARLVLFRESDIVRSRFTLDYYGATAYAPPTAA